MTDKVSEIKTTIRQELGDIPSKLFYDGIDKRLDEYGQDDKALCAASDYVVMAVKLFIGVEQAEVIMSRCRDIIARAA